jgi:hypothetical protein
MACINVNHRRRPAPAKTQGFKGLPDTCEDCSASPESEHLTA